MTVAEALEGLDVVASTPEVVGFGLGPCAICAELGSGALLLPEVTCVAAKSRLDGKDQP